jgi:hypothetical protein
MVAGRAAMTAALPAAAPVALSSAPGFSTRAAQEAHVIPLIDTSTSRYPVADATLVIAAGMQSCLPAE